MESEIMKLAAEFNGLQKHQEEIQKKLDRFWKLVEGYDVDVIHHPAEGGESKDFHFEKWTNEGLFISKTYPEIYQAIGDLVSGKVEWKKEKQDV